jgi:hypothetical protein
MKKPSMANLAEIPQTPVFGKTIRLRPNAKPVTPPTSQKRDNIFSKSRDTREDRGSRQMKTSHESQTFPHGR